MSDGKGFRFQIYTRAYDTVYGFYKDVLKLPVLIRRETGPDDRVAVFGAASGQIEIIYAPEGMEYPTSNGWTLQIEVDDADKSCSAFSSSGYEVLRGPQDQFWGHRNFKILDPTGLELTFYSQIKKIV